MIHAYLSHPGTDHIHLGRANEDRIRVLSRDGLTAAAVCDGAGSFGAGAQAAELVSDALTALLHEEFDRLFSLSADKVRAHLARAVEDVLRVHSRRSGIREQDLACTILAAAAHEDGRCLCLHLGDGIIVQQNEKLVGLVYPDFDDAFAHGLNNDDIERVMEENRVALNAELPAYSQIFKMKIYPEEFEKTPKKSIKRFLYQEAKG